MLRTLYGAVGTLAAPLSSTTKKLIVDSGLSALIHNSLVGSDWAYLAVDDGRNIEIVKLYAPDESGIRIERGKDNTGNYPFPVGARVYYTTTAAEIADNFLASLWTLYPQEAIEVDSGVVKYPEILFRTIGATRAVMQGATIRLFRDEQAYGCCDGNNDPATIPGIPLYLTSRPYPIEATDWYGVGGLEAISGRIINRIDDDLMSVSMVPVEGDLWGGLVANSPDPESIEVAMEPVEGDLWGGLVTYTQPPEYLGVSMHPVEGDLWGAYVAYTHPAESGRDKIAVNMVPISGTLT